MRTYTHCSDATQACMLTRRFAIAYLKSDERARGMHIHDCLELYYSVSGDKQFVVGERLYDAHPGDLFVVNPYEAHRPVLQENTSHERIVVCIHPDYPASLSTHSTDLTSCFFMRPDGFSHRVSLTRAQRAAFEKQLERCAGSEGFGADLLENTSFTELLVMVSGLYLNKNAQDDTPRIECTDARIASILSFIDTRISQQITIEDISDAFYLSKGYLCRVFKEGTGTTLGRYIIARRISLAKKLLAQGDSVHETCEACGFGDYTHFIRAFGQAVGMSPKQYALRHREGQGA